MPNKEDTKHEETLFTILVEAHLETGGDIEIRDSLWTPTRNAIDNAEITGWVHLDRDTIKSTWPNAESAAGGLLLHVKQIRRKLDDVVFYANDDEDRTGTTWRMLKLDMPFLQIVAYKDGNALRSIIRKLSALMLKAMTPEPDTDPSLN
jgi:hypothetical protein